VLLQQLSAHLRELANQVLNGPVDGAELAYILATLIDRIENAPTDPNGRRH
jgi:hypothetical protein